jgi:hypothetical protein
MESPRAAVIFVLGSLLVAGCAAAAPPEDQGDSGESSDALSAPCKLSRAQILGSVSGGRLDAIQRGFGWLDARVPYSQSRSYGGYRTDCSGFVSMCWNLGTSQTTATFAAGASSSALASYSSLQPADALVHRSGGSGHIVLFVGWNDSAHASACVLEEASTASDMQFRTFSVSYLKGAGYKAIRADDLAASSSTPTPPSAPTPPSTPSSPGEPPTTPPDADDPSPPSPTPATPPADPTGGGCYSPTMGQTMPEGACVQSAADEVTEQCHNGLWYRGVSGGDGPFGACQ